MRKDGAVEDVPDADAPARGEDVQPAAEPRARGGARERTTPTPTTRGERAVAKRATRDVETEEVRKV